MNKFYLLTCVFIAATLVADAQSLYSLRRDRSLILVTGLNSSTYYGDLKDNADILDAKPSLSLGLMTSLSKKINIRGEFSWVTFRGRDEESSDGGRIPRNLSFTSSNYEMNVSGIYNFITQRGNRFYQRPNFNVYAFLGIGGMYFNPKAEFEGKLYALQPLQTEGVSYSRFAFVIPYGVGAKIKATPYVNFGIEIGWRKTFTDYLDDVSTTYIDNASIADPIARRLADRRPEIGLPVARARSKRGEPGNKDAYMLLSAKLEYYLPFQVGSGSHKNYKRKRREAYR